MATSAKQLKARKKEASVRPSSRASFASNGHAANALPLDYHAAGEKESPPSGGEVSAVERARPLWAQGLTREKLVIMRDEIEWAVARIKAGKPKPFDEVDASSVHRLPALARLLAE